MPVSRLGQIVGIIMLMALIAFIVIDVTCHLGTFNALFTHG